MHIESESYVRQQCDMVYAKIKAYPGQLHVVDLIPLLEGYMTEIEVTSTVWRLCDWHWISQDDEGHWVPDLGD